MAGTINEAGCAAVRAANHGAAPPPRAPVIPLPTGNPGPLLLFFESSAMACLIFGMFVAVAFGVVTLEVVAGW